MKFYFLSAIALSAILVSGCSKTKSDTIYEENKLEVFSASGPSVRVGIRLYRPKYDCLEKLSLCIGRKKPVPTKDSPEYRDLYYAGEVYLDPNIRVADADIIYLASINSIKIIFKSDFDKSDGTILEIDQGYNNFNLDNSTLSLLGLNNVNLQTGSYQIVNIDIQNNQFGEVIIPMI